METQRSNHHPHPPPQVAGDVSARVLAPSHRGNGTYSSVGSLLLFVSLLVSGSLGFIWCLLLLIQGLPPLAEELADLACAISVSRTQTPSACADVTHRT
jgi:hypothetical protein